ncbi:MAG: FG-GAP-like repeat-containing protein, partial [Bryobacteraceae bacterium]
MRFGFSIRCGAVLCCGLFLLAGAWGQTMAPVSRLSLEVTSGSKPVRLGQPVTLLVRSEEKANAGTKVTFFDGATPLGATTYNDRGVATWQTSLFSVGLHSLRAVAWSEAQDGAPASSSEVTILVDGKQPAKYDRTRTYPAGANPEVIALADLNNDGRADLVVTNANSGSVTVLLGGADGSFGEPARIATGEKPTALAIADFNGDGFTDIAVTDGGAGGLNILLGVGDGSFPRRLDFETASEPSAVAAADFNNDGIPDIAVTSKFWNTVATWIGAGDGTFRKSRELAAGSQPTALAVADMNRDGRTDMAIANFDADSVTVLLGDAEGGFSAAPPLTTGKGPRHLEVRNSGTPSLMVRTAGSRDVMVFTGNADGTFQPGVSYPSDLGADDFARGDVDRDGSTDVAVADAGGNVKILSAVLLAAGTDLSITKNILTTFYQTQTGAAYQIFVTNVGTVATDGTLVTVSDTLPTGLTATDISGSGWTC